MVKFGCISDNHGLLDFDIPDCDILLIAGDVCGPSDIFKQIAFWSGPFKKKFENFDKPILFTAGNHCWVFEKCPYFSPTWLHVLIDRRIEICGFKVYGTPAQKRFFDWAFNFDEPELIRKYSLIPDDTEILLLHQPPYGILDKGIHKENLGSRCLRDRIRELKNLKLVVFGHIHSGYGVEIIDGVTFVNASLCNEDYKLVSKPMVVEI